MKKPCLVFLSAILFIVLACNMPAPGGATGPLPSAENITPLTGAGVQITSPANDSQLAVGQSVQISYVASGGPFLEVDLQVDGQPVTTIPMNSQEPEISGTIEWSDPVDGGHNLTVQVVTLEKTVYSSSVDVTIGVPLSVPIPGQPITQIPDPSLDAARQRVIEILKDHYGLNMTAPPVGRKSRSGVTTDP